jgi:glycosyltransferase involved in cell wall biosynthesis
MRSAADATNLGPSVRHSKMIKVSIVIKALNEETNIARAIESALVAAAPHGGEVIVADSGSMDRTVEIAMRYPTLVVQLENFEERCCGVGPQLGYQHSSGEYIYVLDGDMELDASFLRKALELLDHQPSIAAVGGLVRETRVKNIEFENRARHFLDRQVENGSEVECLVGGGLYRRAAIEEVGYLSDWNLHGFEEYDLGARLRSKGWRLVRLNRHATDHYSYQLSTYRLLWHRVRAGRLLALGEILRAAIRGKYLKGAVVEIRPIRFALGTLLFWIVAGLLACTAQGTELLIVFVAVSATLPIAAMVARSGSLAAGVYSVAVWQLTGITLLLGLARTRKPPTAVIPCRILHTAGTAAAIGTVPTPASELKLKAETANRLQAEPAVGGAGPRPASADSAGCCGSAS